MNDDKHTDADLVAQTMQRHRALVALCAEEPIVLLDTHDVGGLRLNGKGLATTDATAPSDKALVVAYMTADSYSPRVWLRVGRILCVPVHHEHSYWEVIQPGWSYGFMLDVNESDDYIEPPGKVRLYGWALPEERFRALG